MKIKTNDNVKILAGKDKGKTGKIEKVILKDDRVVVSGINIVKKATKPSKKAPKGGIISIPAPIHVSNVALICSKCNKNAKIGYKVISGKKERICKRCKEQV